MADSELRPPLVAVNLPAAKRSKGSRVVGSIRAPDSESSGKNVSCSLHVMYPQRAKIECPADPKPDGRKCKACWLKDDMIDPVLEEFAKTNKEVVEDPVLVPLPRCWWGYMPHAVTGES